MTSVQADGWLLGSVFGILVGEGLLGIEGVLGIGVGAQAGGDPSGEGVNIGLSLLHSLAQHWHPDG